MSVLVMTPFTRPTSELQLTWYVWILALLGHCHLRSNPSGPNIDTSSAAHDASKPPARSACDGPLSAFCGGHPCPTYQDARAEAEKSAVGYEPALCSGMCAGDVHFGQCGGLRFVENGDCLCGSRLYFDSDGKLVGAERRTDVVPCAHRSYGRVPSCP